MKRFVVPLISVLGLFASTSSLAAPQPTFGEVRPSIFEPEETIPVDDEETCWLAPEWRD